MSPGTEKRKNFFEDFFLIPFSSSSSSSSSSTPGNILKSLTSKHWQSGQVNIPTKLKSYLIPTERSHHVNVLNLAI